MEAIIVVLVTANIAFTALLATLVVRQGARLDGIEARIDALNGRIDTVLAELTSLSQRVARLESQR